MKDGYAQVRTMGCGSALFCASTCLPLTAATDDILRAGQSLISAFFAEISSGNLRNLLTMATAVLLRGSPDIHDLARQFTPS